MTRLSPRAVQDLPHGGISTTAWDPLDEPVPFVLTDLREWAATRWMDTEEAARILQMPRQSVAALASRGCVEARKVGHRWSLRREALERYLRERRGRGSRPGRRVRPGGQCRSDRLLSAPLVRLVADRGGLRACNAEYGSAVEMAFYRARRDGWVTPSAADKLAVGLLGLTPWEIWGTINEGTASSTRSRSSRTGSAATVVSTQERGETLSE